MVGAEYSFQFGAKERVQLCSICPVSSSLMAVDAGEKMAVQMEPSKKEGAKGSQVLPSGKQLRARKASVRTLC